MIGKQATLSIFVSSVCWALRCSFPTVAILTPSKLHQDSCGALVSFSSVNKPCVYIGLWLSARLFCLALFSNYTKYKMQPLNLFRHTVKPAVHDSHVHDAVISVPALQHCRSCRWRLKLPGSRWRRSSASMSTGVSVSPGAPLELRRARKRTSGLLVSALKMISLSLWIHGFLNKVLTFACIGVIRV